MVMITRSAYRRACESTNSSDVSQNNFIPPWCSSGKVNERGKPRKVPLWEIRSSYPLRENIWEYLHDREQSFKSEKRKRAKCNCRQRPPHGKGKTRVLFFALLLITIGLISSIWMNNLPRISLLANVITKGNLVALLGMGKPTSVSSEECCHKMRHLAAELTRVEQTLRSYERKRKSLMITSVNTRRDNTETDKKYIKDIVVTRGNDTEEYGGVVALWGIVPMWRAAPPPDTVLSQRMPTPSDCWPFSGSLGEMLLEMPGNVQVQSISLQHIRPDKTSSAPKHFIFSVILDNGTLINAVNSEYKNTGPAKQYYKFNWSNPLKRMVFRVLSNQGNPKYTCLYRVHIYGKHQNSFKFS